MKNYLSKDVQYLFVGNRDTQLKRIRENLREQRDTKYSCLGRITLQRLTFSPELFHRCKVIPERIFSPSFVDFGKLIIKFIWENKKQR